eukprot:3693061-Ditylum_brightwellii.AAC.1
MSPLGTRGNLTFCLCGQFQGWYHVRYHAPICPGGGSGARTKTSAGDVSELEAQRMYEDASEHGYRPKDATRGRYEYRHKPRVTQHMHLCNSNVKSNRRLK